MTTTRTRRPAAPAWFADVAPERRGHWTAGEGRWALMRQTGPLEAIRVALADGTILDGKLADDRAKWDPARYSIALRIDGRKTQKWILARDIAEVWADKGAPLEALLADYLTKSHDALAY